MPFSDTILSETGVPFSGGGRPENDIRKWKPKKSPVSDLQYKIYKPVSRSENVHFRTQKPGVNNWGIYRFLCILGPRGIDRTEIYIRIE